MININTATNYAINNNISTGLNNSIISDNKKTFLNLLTSHTLNKNLSDNELNSDLNVINEISENNINNLFQNDIISMINNYLQTKILSENSIDSNLIKEEKIHEKNENKMMELKNSANITLLNNEGANKINNFKSQINLNSELSKTNELFSEISMKNNLNLNDNKVYDIKVHKQNNVIFQNKNIDVINFKTLINDNINNSEFKSINGSDLNKLLNNLDVENSQNSKTQNVIEKNNFYDSNSNKLRANKDIINNVNDYSKNIIINNNDEKSDLAKIFLKTNLFESRENISQNADNLSELYFESKKSESDNNSQQNYLSTDVNNFNKIIEIADDSNLLKPAVTAQIKDTLNLMYNEKTSQVTMKLNPENLGKIDIKLVYNNDCIKVEITSFNDETNKILNSSVNELISSLKNNTEKPVEVIIKSEINFNDKQFNFSQSSESNYQNEKERKNKYIYHNKFEADEEKNEVFKKLIYL